MATLAALVVSLILVPSGALAQARRRAPNPAPTSADDESATRTHQRAIALFEQSVEAYRAGRFAEAATMLREAHRLEPTAVLLYNLARALDADGQIVEARDTYRLDLEAEPDAAQRATCERRIEVLDAQILAAERSVARPIEPTSTPIAAPPVEPPPSEGADATPAWVVLGVGAAGAVAGGVLLGVAVSEHDAAVREPVSVRADEVDRGAIALRDAGVAVTVIGAAAAAAGLTWGLVASSSGPSSATHVAIGPQGVTVTGTF